MERVSVVYAATTQGEIFPFRVGAGGAFVPISKPVRVLPASDINNPQRTASLTLGLAIHPQKRFAFAANQDDKYSMVFQTTLQGYHIAPDGALRPLALGTIQIDDVVGDLFISPSGRYLYLNGNQSLWIYGIRSSGHLDLFRRAQPLGTFGVSNEPETRARMRDWDFYLSSVAFFSSGNSFLVFRQHQWQSDQTISTCQYRISADGSYSQIPSLLDDSKFFGRFHLSGDGQRLYRNANDWTESKAHVEVYRILPGDRLTPVPTAGIPTSLKAIAAYDPRDRFVFGIASGSLTTYRVQSDGTLTSVGSTRLRDANADRAFVESSGRFLYVAPASRTLVQQLAAPRPYDYEVFAIAANGSLTPTRGKAILPQNTCDIATAC